MKPQTLVMLLLALGSGLGAMVLVQKYVAKDTGKPEGTHVLVAAADIPAGTALNEQNTAEIVYNGKLPEDAKKAEERELVYGRIATQKILKEDLIREAKLGKKGDTDSLAVMLRKRENGELERAVTVRVATSGAAAGFIRPDSLVDISVFIPPAGNRQAVLKTFLRKMRVIAVNSQMQRPGNEVQAQGQNVEMVTFAATREEAEKLTIAEASGTLKLALRSSDDKEVDAGSILSIDDVMKGKQSTVTSEDSKEGDKLDPTKVVNNAKPGLLDSITTMFNQTSLKAGEGKGEPVINETPKTEGEKPDLSKSVVQAPQKKRWKLVQRDHQGNPVKEIVLDDDSKWVRSLRDLGLLEAVEAGEASLEKDGKAVAPVSNKAATTPKVSKK